MNLLYKSTRDAEKTVTASQAILKGLADDGGLFVPDSIPKLPVSLGELARDDLSGDRICGYEAVSLTDFTEEELKNCIAKAYDSKFDTEEIAPLAKADGCLLSGTVPRSNDRIQGYGTFHSATSSDYFSKEESGEE